MKGLPARTGLEWLKQGFMLFRRQPGVLTMLVFANLLLTMLLSYVPLLGMILSFVFIPCFSMAIQQACLEIDQGQAVHPRVLLTGFRRNAFGPLCKLGLVYLAAFVLLLLAVAPWINVDAMQQAAKSMEAKQQPVIDRGTMTAVLVFFCLFCVTMLGLSFAPALTVWKRMPTFKAIFYSVFAVFGSLRAMLVMLIYWLAIYWTLLIVVGMLLGRSQFVFVVFMWLALISTLILQCAIFAAYKRILGAPEADNPPYNTAG